MAETILKTENLTKRFGGLVAVDKVNLELVKGEVHAILGPNGAGKSTLVNLLSGDMTSTEGTITFEGKDLTGLPPYVISHYGLGRSFQKTNIFPKLSCFENVWLAAQSRQKTSMRFFRPARRMKEVEQLTLSSLEKCGLLAQKDVIASSMSYGEQRQLEIGMMLATQPRLLLMDEPMAGMGKEESEMLVQLIKDLAKDYTLLLIEHDMDAVFAVANRLTVMVNGRVLETGTPDQIRSSQQVQEAYLGSEGGF
ncbi:ABC transporter ATP-binding protein [Terasakiella pusilla]|jgi:branched-chain amino acid transport system ATP-binding protein|uniref:ABC transporter ATP-binding protein n=1 Tax=Terasakiella pusilla TaxID=64973 RepID=UPI00048D2751|nr:ABC transporter ATP-binding protein [Terasakiella pusilla]